MALAKITFVKNGNGLGRTRAGQDHISGLIFYNDVKPASWDASDIQEIFSLGAAEELGLTAATHAIEHYHISQFFALNPNGHLWVGIFDVPVGSYDFTEIATLQTKSVDTIRQVGVYADKVFAPGDVSVIQAVAAGLDPQGPLSVVYAADISGVADLSALTDIHSGTSNKVSVDIGQGGDGLAADLFNSLTQSIGTVGAIIAAIANAAVHEDISWVEKFDVAAANLAIPSFGNGDLFTDKTPAELDAIDNKGYIFPVKYADQVGTYLSSAKTGANNDFDSIQKNRAIDKAIRLIRYYLTPKLNSPVYLNEDGTLTEDSVRVFESVAGRGVQDMLRSNELSAGKVVIDPTQDIASTDTLSVTVQLVPVGTARSIEVIIGFTPNISI